MSVLELYDGESRSRIWWKVVKRHTVFVAFLLSLSGSLLFFGLSGIHGPDVLIGIFIGAVILFLALWPILIGLSLLAPRLAFSFFYWNGWLVLMLLIPAFFFSALLLALLCVVLGLDLNRSPCIFIQVVGAVLPIALIAAAIFIKTLILYKRFKVVSQEKDKQSLPV